MSATEKDALFVRAIQSNTDVVMDKFTESFEIELFGCDQDCVVQFFIDEGDIDIMYVTLDRREKIRYSSKGEYVEEEITNTIDIKNVLCKEQLKEIEEWVKERISDNS